MTLIPLDIPAGFYRNGTDLEQAGRWRDGSLVRWRDGSLRPVKGWLERKSSFSTNIIRGMHAWESLNGSAYVAGGSYNELKAMVGGGTLYDITPSDLTAGLEKATVITGYGYGDYGDDSYGVERPNYGNYSEANTWSLDNWGEYLVACSYGDGRLLEWQLGASTDAAAISNAPTNNLGLVTTEERFLFALGAGGNPRKVQWCDQENNTTWTAAATNQAGDIELQTAGQIMQGIRTRGQTLIITDTDAHAARYIGPPFVFGFERVGTACGAISRKAAVDVDQGVFWMGQRGFFTFAGNTVQEVPCQVHDYVFDDFNREQQSQVWAWSNTEYGEIWWFYASSGSTEVDRYVAFDYLEGHWTIGELARTAGVSRGVFKRPFMIGTDKTVYEHEVGNDYDSATIFAETGPVSLGNGDQTMNVLQLIPDEKTQGQVSVKFKSRFYPNAAETTHGPYTPANPTDVRFSGRQFRMRVEGAADADWRVGVMRVDAIPAGKR